MRQVPLASGWDLPFLAALLLLGLLGGRLAAPAPGPATGLRIRDAGGTRDLPLLAGPVSARGPLGDSHLHVSEAGEVAFTDSPCPGHLCLAMGRIQGAGSALACVPNRVLVELTGPAAGADLDAVTR